MSKLLFVINAVILVAFGLLLLVAPEMGLGQFAMSARVQELFMARVIGAALVSLGVLLWFAKDADEALQKKFGMAALVSSVLGLIVTIIGVVGVVKGLAWLAIVLEVIFALGYSFVLFMQPRMKE
jgi:hypothetical protein